MNFFKTQKYGRKVNCDLLQNAAPRMNAFSRETTIMDIKRHIATYMRGIFSEAPENDEELNEIIEVHVKENLPKIKKGYSS